MSKAKVTFPTGGTVSSAINVEDEGVLVVANPTDLNFVGAGVNVVQNPTGTAEITIPGNPVTIQDETLPILTNPANINFAGAGVTVTNSPPGTALVTIPADGVEFWTESEASATQQNTRWIPNNVAANVTAVIQPKGQGANTAQRPDGTTTGGNARGIFATDWQKSRTNANQVASGIYATIPGGLNNTASGLYTFAATEAATASGTASVSFGGTASGQRSFSGASQLGVVASGTNSAFFGSSGNASGSGSFGVGDGARARLLHQFCHGNEFNNLTSTYILKRNADLTTGDTAKLSLDGTGTTNLLTLGNININNCAWNVVASWVAVVTAISGTATGVSVGDAIIQDNLFGIKKIGLPAVTSIIGGTVTNVGTHNDASMATASMAFTASPDELVSTFTAPTFSGGGTLTIQITCKILSVERHI